MLASDEAAIFRGGPLQVMLLALRHRLAWEVGTTVTALGQWSYGPHLGGICVKLDPADIADERAFAERVAAYWTEHLEEAWRIATVGLEKLRGVSEVEVVA